MNPNVVVLMASYAKSHMARPWYMQRCYHFQYAVNPICVGTYILQVINPLHEYRSGHARLVLTKGSPTKQNRLQNSNVSNLKISYMIAIIVNLKRFCVSLM